MSTLKLALIDTIAEEYIAQKNMQICSKQTDTVSESVVNKESKLQSLEYTIALLRRDIQREDKILAVVETFLTEKFGKGCIDSDSKLRDLNILKVNIQVPEDSYTQYIDSSAIERMTHFFTEKFNEFFSSAENRSHGYMFEFRHSRMNQSRIFADIHCVTDKPDKMVVVMF